MTCEARGTLALAVRRDSVCMLYLRGRDLLEWRVSAKAGTSPENAGTVVQAWISRYDPDIAISQNPDACGRKGRANKAILSTIAIVLEDADLLDKLVVREQLFDNLYAEALDLARRYPALAHKLPSKPNIWDTEPRAVIYFEALAMFEQVNTS